MRIRYKRSKGLEAMEDFHLEGLLASPNPERVRKKLRNIFGDCL